MAGFGTTRHHLPHAVRLPGDVYPNLSTEPKNRQGICPEARYHAAPIPQQAHVAALAVRFL